MKKLLVLLLVPVLIVTMISCDGDFRSSATNFLQMTQGNVYINSGIVKPNTSQAEAVITAVANTTSTTVNDVKQAYGLPDSLNISAPSSPIIAPQSPTDKKATEQALSTTFNSPTQTAKLVEEMKKPATTNSQEAAQGSLTVAKEIASAAAGIDGLPSELQTMLTSMANTLDSVAKAESLTQGDVLLTQMMTNMVSSLATVADNVAKNPNSIDSGKLLEVVDDALFLSTTAQQLSGVANQDIVKLLDLSSLMGSLTKSAGASDSVVLLSLADLPAEYLKLVNIAGPIIASYVGAASDGTIDKAQYEMMIRMLSLSVMATEQNMALVGQLPSNKVPAGFLESCKLTGMMNYFVAVAFVEMDGFSSKLVGKKTVGDDEVDISVSVRELLQSLFKHTPKFATGTLSGSDSFNIGSDIKARLVEILPENADKETIIKSYLDPAFKERVKNAIKTVGQMAKYSAGDEVSDWISNLIESFLPQVGGAQ